ncbi:Hypothetical protein FKW44_013084, partial [Caligus rogercresseyi]
SRRIIPIEHWHPSSDLFIGGCRVVKSIKILGIDGIAINHPCQISKDLTHKLLDGLKHGEVLTCKS